MMVNLKTAFERHREELEGASDPFKLEYTVDFLYKAILEENEKNWVDVFDLELFKEEQKEYRERKVKGSLGDGYSFLRLFMGDFEWEGEHELDLAIADLDSHIHNLLIWIRYYERDAKGGGRTDLKKEWDAEVKKVVLLWKGREALAKIRREDGVEDEDVDTDALIYKLLNKGVG